MGKYTIRKAGLLSNLLHPDIELSTSADLQVDQEKIPSDKQPQVKEAGRFLMISLWWMLTYRYSKGTPSTEMPIFPNCHERASQFVRKFIASIHITHYIQQLALDSPLFREKQTISLSQET